MPDRPASVTETQQAGESAVTEPLVVSGSAASYLPARASQVVSASSPILVTDGEPVTPFTMASNVILTATPSIAAGRTGQLVVLVNREVARVLTVSDESSLPGSLLQLGAPSRAVVPGGTLSLVYDSTVGAWVEVASQTLTSPSITDFNEAAQDAVGGMVDSSLVYTDATPLLALATKHKTRVRHIRLGAPGTNEKWPLFREGDPFTITKVTHKTSAGTCPFNLEYHTTIGTSTGDVWSSNKTAGTTQTDETSFTDATGVADAWVVLSVEADPSGDVGILDIAVEYTMD